MREKMVRAIIERWHPGAMAWSLAENGSVIVPPHTLAEAQAAADAALDAMMEPTDAMKATITDHWKDWASRIATNDDPDISYQIEAWMVAIKAAKDGK